MTPVEYEAEIARLHAFTVRLAEHLAAASEVLSNLAERKNKQIGMTPTGDNSNPDEDEAS